MITEINPEFHLDLEEVVLLVNANYGQKAWLLYLFHMQSPLEIDAAVAGQILDAIKTANIKVQARPYSIHGEPTWHLLNGQTCEPPQVEPAPAETITYGGTE